MPPEETFSHKCCIRCVHWHQEFCFRYPPTPSWNEVSGKDRFARYPAVAPGNWCGEFAGTTSKTFRERIEWIKDGRN